MWYILAANINIPIDNTKIDLRHAGGDIPAKEKHISMTPFDSKSDNAFASNQKENVHETLLLIPSLGSRDTFLRDRGS